MADLSTVYVPLFNLDLNLTFEKRKTATTGRGPARRRTWPEGLTNTGISNVTGYRAPHAGGAEVNRRTCGLKSSTVAAQPGEWVQQALVAGHAQAILAAADQIRGGLEGLVAEGAFFALHLGPACVSLFVDDAFTFHGPAFHARVSSDHRHGYTNPMPSAFMLWKIPI